MKSKWTLCLLPSFATVSMADVLTKEELAAELPGVEAHEIHDSPIPGMFEVAVGPNVAYVSEDGRFFIQGDLYDLDSNENLTEQRRSHARADVLAGIDPETMIVFSPAPEDVKHTVTIFTDIDSIPLGVNFKKYIDEQVGKCDIFLAVIGEKWLSATDDGDRPRRPCADADADDDGRLTRHCAGGRRVRARARRASSASRASS